MKLTNKQKSIIWKSLKLNEDFFDDLDNNNLIDEPNHDFFGESIDDIGYTYDIYFIIYLHPFIKKYNKEEPVYSFEENPEYKPIVESTFLSMKKALNYILQVTPIITDYSEPKFCSSYEKIIKAFPFMNNGPSNKFENFISGEHFITLKTSINLSRRKNEHNLLKMFYSFWRLQKLYEKLVTTIYPNKDRTVMHISVVFYKNNSCEKSFICSLIPSGQKPNSYLLETINFLNDKDETDE